MKSNINVLFLSCGTSEGHNHAAHAIGDALKDRGISDDLANPIALYSQRVGDYIDSTYNRMIQKTPEVFNLLYRVRELYGKSGLHSPVYNALAWCADRLRYYIEENHYSAVICIHLYALEIMTADRKNSACKVPCFGVLTDYTCIPFAEETYLDRYFIPHSDIIEELVRKGISKDKIYPTGIPVSKPFTKHIEKTAARNALGIPIDVPFILIMGGSAGCGNVVKMCRWLLKYPGEWLAVIIIGRNKETFEMLKKRFQKKKSILPILYTDNVNLYMAAADVVLTKPGGLASTEAAVLNIPLIHFHGGKWIATAFGVLTALIPQTYIVLLLTTLYILACLFIRGQPIREKVFLLFGLISVIYFLALKKISFAIGCGMIEGITAFCHRRKNPTQKEAVISFNDKCR